MQMMIKVYLLISDENEVKLPEGTSLVITDLGDSNHKDFKF